MAKSKVSGSNGLNFTAKLSIEEAKKSAAELKKVLGDLGISASKGFEQKPLTEYQAGLLKIKQEALELAKQKAEQTKADKAASLATQQALREERELIKQRNAEAKRARIISESTANDISNSTGGLNGRTVVKGSPILPDEIKKNQIDSTASAYTAQTNAIKENTKATKENSLSKKELAIIAAQEKLNNQQNAAALKNQAREMNAAKGSIEQRRAALIRLNKVYDNLNVAERQSASGMRLEGIVGRLTTQLKEQEAVTGRAQRNVGNYTSAFANGAGKVWGALRQVANILPGVGIAGLLAFAIDPLMEYLKGLDLFRAKVTQAKVAQEDMAKALAGSEYAKAVTNVNELRINIDLAKQGLISKESVLKQYNDTIGKTTGQVKTLDQAEQDLNKNADAFIKVTLLKAAAQVALESAAKSAYEAEISRRKKLEEFGNNFLDADVSNVRSEGQYKANQQNIINQRKRRQAEEVKISQDSANQQIAIAKKFQQDAAKISQSNGFVNFLGNDEKKAVKAIQSQINAQRNLQLEIDALVNKGRGKRLSDDEQELADVDAKYKKLREKAIAFNSNPKNKAKGLKVDTGGLALAQSDEEDALRDKQASEKLKITLDKQKKYYEEFEQYRVTYGEEKAKERYKNLIDTDKSYLQKLKEMEGDILNPEKSKGADNLYDGKSEKQLKQIRESIEAETQAEQKKNDALLKEFMDYSQKRKVLIETYNRDYAELANSPNEQAERTRRYNKDLKELDDANGDKLSSYSKMFEGIEKLSVKSALKLVQTARKALADRIKSGEIISPEELNKINALFDETESKIREGSGQALMDLARQVDEVASAVSGVNEEFGKVLGTLGNVIGQVGNIKKGFKDLKSGQSTGSVTSQLTAGLGIFGAGLSIFQTIASFFDNSAKREAQAAYFRDLQNKQTEALNRALERQIALLDDVYGTERISNYSEAIKQARDNEAKYASQLVGRYQLTGDAQLDEFIAKLNNGEKINPTYNGLVEKAKRNSAILPTDLQSLQRLLDEGKLDANTSNIVTNLLKAKQTAEELVNSLRQEVVGTTLAEVADDFIKTLTDGTQDFGKTFEETMQKSILNSFKGELIRKQLQAFYTQFAELSEGGLTSKEIETLRASYLAASEKAKTDLEALSKATGIDLSGKGSPANSLTGAFTAASQESITLLAGQTGGMRIAQIQTNLILTNQGKTLGDLYQSTLNSFAELQAIQRNTLRTADNTERLKAIEGAIVSIDRKTGGSSYNPQMSAGGIKI